MKKPISLQSVIAETIKTMKETNTVFTPCSYHKMFILTAKSLGMAPREIIAYLCDEKETLRIEEELQGMAEELLTTANAFENTVNATHDDVNNLLEVYTQADLENAPEESMSLYFLKLKQENLLMQKKLNSTLSDLKDQKRSFERINNLINTDLLMGIYSRRYLEKKLKDLLYEYKRYDKPFSVLMIDIDDFKIVNDKYGHLVGDKVLAKVGEILKASLRQLDIPSRYGGDEIVVLLPNTKKEEAFKAALKIQSIFQKARFKTSQDEFSITASIGIYEVQPKDDFETILNKTDNAMYEAKAKGKNAVVMHQ